MLNTLSARKSILAIIAIMIAMLLVLVIPLRSQLSGIDSATHRHATILQAVLALKDTRFHVVQIQQFLTDVAATGDREVFAEADANLAAAHASLAQLARVLPDRGAEIEALRRAAADLHRVGTEMALTYIEQGRAAGNAIMQRTDTGLDALSSELAERLEHMSDQLSDELGALSGELLSTVSFANGTVASYSIVVVALTLVLMGLLYRKLIPPLLRLRDSMRGVAQGAGDLTQRLPTTSHDEIGQAATSFNTFLDSLHDMVVQILGVSVRLSSSSEQLAHGTDMTLRYMGELEADTARIASDLQQVAGRVHDIAERTGTAADSAARASEAAGNGRAGISDAMGTLTQLVEDMNAAVEVTRGLENDSNNIGSILDVIRSISEQTNLLALNAAIEAARAGEAGRGFAVVAEEVRTLATKTQEATTEIQDKIESLQQRAQASVAVMIKGGSDAENSSEQAQTALASLDEITRAVEEMRQMNNEIADVARGQSASAVEIEISVSRLAQLAGKMVVDAQQAVASGVQMDMMASQLHGLVDQFKVRRSDDAGGDQPLVVWGPQLAVNVKDIDEQHQRLVRIVNQLHAAYAKGSGKTVLDDVFKSLFEYANTHFRFEEDRMQRAGYPGFEEHRRQHQAQLQRLQSLYDSYGSGDNAVMGDLMSFLKQWILGHIQKSDRDAARHLSAC